MPKSKVAVEVIEDAQRQTAIDKFNKSIDDTDWWKKDTSKFLKDTFKTLVNHGISPEKADDLIWDLVSMIQEEYGE